MIRSSVRFPGEKIVDDKQFHHSRESLFFDTLNREHVAKNIWKKEAYLVQVVVEPVPPLLQRVRVVNAHIVQALEGERAVVCHC